MAYTFEDDVFVVDCWIDTKDKENVLKELINKLKVYNCPIILCGHYAVNPEIQKSVNYFIYDSDNDLLLEKDFHDYGVNSDRWTDMGSYRLTNKTKFHHDYAIWLTMKNAFNLANQLGKKYIHFLEYDNLPDEIQYRQAFMEYVRGNDAVIYEYDKGSTQQSNPYCATYIFSIKTETALKLISTINSKEEFFKNKPDRWQLEKNFYQRLKEVTNSIFVSKYIPNNNELNIFAAWNRNGIYKGDARFQTYLGVDDNNKLYIHFISGFSEKLADKDYLVEINYSDRKEFFTIKKGEYHLGLLGNYIQGETIRVFYQGIEMFSETLNENVNDFKRKNYLRKNINYNGDRRININFIDGPFVEIKENGNYNYQIDFVNRKNGKTEFQINLKSNHWAKAGKKYAVDWLIKIKGIDNDFYQEYEFNPKNQKVFIVYETKSLGDTLAFFPYVEKYRTDNECKVVVSTFHNNLFRDQYPDIEFVEPGTTVQNVYALFRLGMFYKTENGFRQVDSERHPHDPKPLPLMRVASDILNLKYVEIRPKLKQIGSKKEKRVCIGLHSTAQAKYWNNPKGWQEVTDYLLSKGYEVRLLSKEEDGYMGNKHPIGVTKQPTGSLDNLIKVLQESELFIGISSGLSWLSWASGTPTIVVSGFTDIDLEPLNGVERVINKEVCNSCWSKYDFDPGDWNWCPVHKNTNRQFECTKNITSDVVIEKINQLLF